MINTRPILKLKFKTPPVLQPKKLEVYIPDKENITKKQKPDILSTKSTKFKENHGAKETNSCHNKINKNTSVVPDQEIINARRARHKAQYQEVLQILQELYPHAFTMPAKPLAVGIHKELLQLAPNGFSRIRIRRFLQQYCQNFTYQQLLVEGAVRVNLDGSEHSKVTKEQVPSKRKIKSKT